MGNCANFQEIDQFSFEIISNGSFVYKQVIGRGGFGRVWQVKNKVNRQKYALKQMQKHRIIQKRSVNNILNERKILSILWHPFIVNINYAYQDRDNLYLVLDFLSGGDLRYNLFNNVQLNESQLKFLICNIILGLEYLRQNGVVHRDLKPENIVLDSKGYARITDFGISRFQQEIIGDSSGTVGYMAPETLMRQCQGYHSDYFSLGIIAYEIIMNRRPYIGKSRQQIRDQIITKEIKIQDLPQGWSIESADFVNKLLIRNPTKRLGYKEINELKNHSWLKGVQWEQMQEKTLKAPFIPSQGDNFDYYYVNSNWEDSRLAKKIQPDLFKDYYFNKDNKTSTSELATIYL